MMAQAAGKVGTRYMTVSAETPDSWKVWNSFHSTVAAFPHSRAGGEHHDTAGTTAKCTERKDSWPRTSFLLQSAQELLIAMQRVTVNMHASRPDSRQAPGIKVCRYCCFLRDLNVF